MSETSPLSRSWEPVARHLPFSLDDVSAVNRTFVRWLDKRRRRDGRLIQLWTYCYVHRYFT